MSGKEEALGGTNASVVARVDSTLRRPRKPCSEAVQALPRHLRASKAWPEPLGFDEKGRETLSYVKDEAGSVL